MAYEENVNIKNPLIYWTVRIVFRSVLFCLCIMGIITIYIMIQKDKRYMLLLQTDPVNGGWSIWSNWSGCNVSCSNKTHHFYGKMQRMRNCDSPKPNSSGKPCIGDSIQTEDCINYKCEKDNLKWSQWSQYSPCSLTCGDSNSIGYTSRFRKCKITSGQCEGKSVEYNVCKPSVKCPDTGVWGEFHIKKRCTPENTSPCSKGYIIDERKCLKDSCEGTTVRQRQCWYQVGCPVDIQPPQNVELLSRDGKGNFGLTWYIVPYGEKAVSYKIYVEILDSSNSITELQVFSMKPVIKEYSKSSINTKMYKLLDLTDEFLRFYPDKFSRIRVGIVSVDRRNKESQISYKTADPMKVIGVWSNWGFFMGCTSKCRQQAGVKTRTRVCEFPGFDESHQITDPAFQKIMCKGKSAEYQKCRNVYQECR